MDLQRNLLRDDVCVNKVAPIRYNVPACATNEVSYYAQDLTTVSSQFSFLPPDPSVLQAQECFFEKVTAENKSSTLCAKIAKQVGLFYEEAHAALVLPPLNQHFDKVSGMSFPINCQKSCSSVGGLGPFSRAVCRHFSAEGPCKFRCSDYNGLVV